MPQNRDGEPDAFTTLEALETRLAVRDVGRRTVRGVSREDILVEYPDLRDQDIERAKRIVTVPGSRNESFEEMAEIDGTRFRRRPVDSHLLEISEFDRW
ncbi:MAG TPA: DUF433 domain-containing protein [Kofleriaceae bacterium]|jgi:hypothetical protein